MKLWANPECKAMFPQRLRSMYQTVTGEGQGLSWELKVAAQEHQKLFLHNMLFQVQEKKIHEYPYQVNNMWFHAQVRKIHQYIYQT